MVSTQFTLEQKKKKCHAKFDEIHWKYQKNVIISVSDIGCLAKEVN